MAPSRLIRLQACVVDLERGKVLRDGRETSLTSMESALLHYLLERAGEPVDQDVLLREVWDYHDAVVSRTVRTTINRLRKKIERDPSDPDHLVTVYGQGYAFKPPVEPDPEERFPTNLPAEVDAFFGREAALAAIERQLARGRRLLTLIGPAGIGKTRLAQRHALASAQPAWFCDLTTAVTGVGIAGAVADALSLPLEGRADPVDQVGRALRGRGDVLLVLDNFEQVVEHAASTVGPWLETAPRARILVTSREPLNLRAEAVVEVGPLEPDAAVHLFIDRVRSRRDDAVLPEAEVASLVEALDRLPLAIELAASRADAADLAGLRAKLANRLDALRTSLRDVDPRHATLRAALDGSWDLLDPVERATLARCAVFRGGWTPEAADAVLDPGPGHPPVSRLVERLVARSLVRAPMDGRYRLFESIRAYAGERLPEDDPAHVRHAAWFAGFGTDEHLAALISDGGIARLRALQDDIDNLLAATERAVRDGDADTATRACLAAARAQEGMVPGGQMAAWIDRVLALDLEDGQRMRLQWARTHALRLGWHPEEAVQAAAEAIETARRLGDRGWEGRALHARGLLEAEAEDRDGATRSFLAALDALRDAGDRATEARALSPLAIMRLRERRLEEARALLEEALAISREAGDAFNEGSALGNLCTVLREMGQLRTACERGRESIAIALAIGNRRKEAMTRLVLAMALDTLGDTAEAAEHHRLAASMFRALGHGHYEGIAVGHLANAIAVSGLPAEAIPLYRRSIVLLQEAGARSMEGVMAGNLGDACLEAGEVDEAQVHLDRAIEVLGALRNDRGVGAFLGSRGVLRARSGDLEGAWQDFARGEALLRSAHDPIELAKLVSRRAEEGLAVGRREEAAADLAVASTLTEGSHLLPHTLLARRLARLREALAPDV